MKIILRVDPTYIAQFKRDRDTFGIWDLFPPPYHWRVSHKLPIVWRWTTEWCRDGWSEQVL